MTDPRLEAINLLIAIQEHDPNLSLFDQMDIERVKDILQRSMSKDIKFAAQDNAAVPAGGTHE